MIILRSGNSRLSFENFCLMAITYLFSNTNLFVKGKFKYTTTSVLSAANYFRFQALG